MQRVTHEIQQLNKKAQLQQALGVRAAAGAAADELPDLCELPCL